MHYEILTFLHYDKYIKIVYNIFLNKQHWQIQTLKRAVKNNGNKYIFN